MRARVEKMSVLGWNKSYADCLDLGEDTVPRITVANCFQSIGINPITYENSFPPRKQALVSQRQVNYVEYMIVTRDTANLGISRRGVIQTISDIGQSSSYFQADNHLNCLIR